MSEPVHAMQLIPHSCQGISKFLPTKIRVGRSAQVFKLIIGEVAVTLFPLKLSLISAAQSQPSQYF